MGRWLGITVMNEKQAQGGLCDNEVGTFFPSTDFFFCEVFGFSMASMGLFWLSRIPEAGPGQGQESPIGQITVGLM